jgi:peptidyl-prolyl cis-trans isomerase SurA
MEKRMFGKAVVYFLLGVFLLLPPVVMAEILDKIVAVVNEDVITLSELREISVPYLERMKAQYSINYDEAQVKETEKRILDQLIDEKLVKQEADSLEIVIEKKDIDMAIRETRETNKLSEDQFKQILADEGMSLEKYRGQLNDQMKKMRLLDQEIKSKVQVAKKEIEEYHKEHKDEFDAPPEVRLQQVLLMIPSEASTQEIDRIRGKAEDILQKIRNGENFNAMVKLHSQDSSAAAGGDMGAFKKGELMPVLDETAFGLKKGEVSSVIQSPMGFHILRVLDKRESQKMTEEERWRETEGIIYNKKVEDKFKDWLKELRKKSFIQINM